MPVFATSVIFGVFAVPAISGIYPWNLPAGQYLGWGYPHDGRADKDSYPHDCRADNAPYRHDRRADKNPYPHDRNMRFSSKLNYALLSILIFSFL